MESEQHKNKYAHNKKFLDFIAPKKKEFGDWYINVVYFSAYHLICAHLAKRQTSNIHDLSEKIMRFIPECHNDFISLESKIRLATYGWMSAPIEMINRADESLKSIERSIKDSYHSA